MKNKFAYIVTAFTLFAVVLVYATVENSNQDQGNITASKNSIKTQTDSSTVNPGEVDKTLNTSLANTINPLAAPALATDAPALVIKATLSETCKDKIDPAAQDRMKLRDCVREYLDTSVKSKGFAATAHDLEKSVGEHQEFNLVCHPFAHYIGKGALNELGSIKKAIGAATSFCAWGYLHGMNVEAASKYKDQELFDVIYEGCMYVKSLNANYFECAHGMGDAFNVANNNDIMKAFSWCQKISDQGMHANCSQGVVNNWADYYIVNEFLEDPKKMTPEQLYLLDGHPYFVCEGVTNSTDRGACFDYMIRVNNAYKSGLQNWEKYCNAYKARDNVDCFQGLGREWSFSKSLSNIESVTKCTLANESDAAALCTQEIINAKTQIYQDTKGTIIKEICENATLKKNVGIKKGCEQAALALKPYFAGNFKL